MGQIQKLTLSSSSLGSPIQISALNTPGTTIHTTSTSATIIDEVWLYATNLDNVSRVLTIEFGGTANSQRIEVTLPAKSGLSVVVPGAILTGSGSSGSTISAFTTSTNVINVIGYINRITP